MIRCTKIFKTIMVSHKSKVMHSPFRKNTLFARLASLKYGSWQWKPQIWQVPKGGIFTHFNHQQSTYASRQLQWLILCLGCRVLTVNRALNLRGTRDMKLSLLTNVCIPCCVTVTICSLHQNAKAFTVKTLSVKAD